MRFIAWIRRLLDRRRALGWDGLFCGLGLAREHRRLTPPAPPVQPAPEALGYRVEAPAPTPARGPVRCSSCAFNRDQPRLDCVLVDPDHKHRHLVVVARRMTAEAEGCRDYLAAERWPAFSEWLGQRYPELLEHLELRRRGGPTP